MSKQISRKYIDQFIAQKNLHNVVGLLRYITKPKHAKIFMDQAKLKLPTKFGRRILFHGSQNYSRQLTISQKEKLVYATDDPNYAIFLGVIHLDNANAGVLIQHDQTKLTVNADFVNGKSSLEDGWVHVVSGENFNQQPNHEYVSTMSAETLFAIPVSFSDLTVPIQIETQKK